MPPKVDKGQLKAAQKKKQAAAADLTFGLKNKNKSKVVQKFVSQVENSAKLAGRSRKDVMAEEAEKKARALAKEEKAMRAAELGSLFKTVVTPVQQHLAEGADPKSQLCAYFKAGNCIRGSKCKFSHDLSLDRKTAKINVYADPRDAERAQDTMDTWDQSKLEAVIAEKAGRENLNLPTEIICKYFLEALETKKYGWFWECPNGNKTCKYRHSLPPGYVLKSESKANKDADDEEKIPIEVEIEDERKKLDLSKCTKVTLESFMKWKEEKKRKKREEIEKQAKEAEAAAGKKGAPGLSGRALFTYDPTLFVDDADAAADDDYEFDGDESWQQEEHKDSVAQTASAFEENLFLEEGDLPDEDD